MATPLGAMHTPDCGAFRGVSPSGGGGGGTGDPPSRTCVGTPGVGRIAPRLAVVLRKHMQLDAAQQEGRYGGASRVVAPISIRICGRACILSSRSAVNRVVCRDDRLSTTSSSLSRHPSTLPYPLSVSLREVLTRDSYGLLR